MPTLVTVSQRDDCDYYVCRYRPDNHGPAGPGRIIGPVRVVKDLRELIPALPGIFGIENEAGVKGIAGATSPD
ncbi:MAG: hypothetical protein HQK58_12145, partial [Deltaproteobacteria bacterium]|nr:hypothetical protein [Deltaproteobacteria bacterium]